MKQNLSLTPYRLHRWNQCLTGEYSQRTSHMKALWCQNVLYVPNINNLPMHNLPYPFLQEVVGEGNQTGRASKHSIRPEKFLVYGARWSDIELLWMQPLIPSIVNGTQTLILTVGKGLLTFNVPAHCPDSIGVTRKFRDSHFRYLIEEIDHRSSEHGTQFPAYNYTR